MDNKFMVLDIQRFADGGGADGAGTGEGAAIAQPQTGGDGVINTAGSNASDAGEQNPTATTGEAETPTLDSIFEKYPELKKEADKRTQKAVKDRLYRENKSMKPVNNIVDKLMVMHGAKSLEELDAKIDGSMKEEFALKHGLDNELSDELINFRVSKLQNDRNRSYYESEMKAERQLKAWQKEADEVKGIYADFDLAAELENPDFVRLISADERYRMPMKQVYELIHHDELIKAAEKRAAVAYSRSVNANLARPGENGTGNQSAVSGISDVSKLTKKERADLAKRAAKGETITLR